VIGGGFLGTEIALGLAKRARAHKLRNPAAGKIKIQVRRARGGARRARGEREESAKRC